jgi:hypothetical protein
MCKKLLKNQKFLKIGKRFFMLQRTIRPGREREFTPFLHIAFGQIPKLCFKIPLKNAQYGTHHSYVLVVHTLRVAENEILKLDLPANVFLIFFLNATNYIQKLF